MLKSRQSKGFTLIELLVVVVIIGILAAIALPNFIGAQKKAKVSSVKSNMHAAQVCAESYGTDAGGSYGPAAADILPYFPGGGNAIGQNGSAKFPLNPFTGAASVPGAATDNTIGTIQTDRASITAKACTSGKGNFGYSGFSSTGGATNDTYSIDGGDDNGNMVLGNGGKLILSNQ